MAVYKLFPEKDASLYSLFRAMNTGLDSQLESSTTAFGASDPNPQVSRFLVQFNNTEIGAVLNLISGSETENEANWKAYLRLNSSKATGLALDSTIDIHLAAKNWDMGTGLYLDSPITTNGCSWVFRDFSGSLRWLPPGDPFTDGFGKYTGSFATGSTESGGGVWYYQTTGSDEYNWNLSESVTFNFRSDLDVNKDVTELVYQFAGVRTTGSQIVNNGFLIKQSGNSYDGAFRTGSGEWIDSKDRQVELKYFSVDTSTIYPPQLEFRWDDYSFNTGSSPQTILTSSSPYISLAENPGEFNINAKNRFRIYARPEYPDREFITGSYYTNNYFLPESSSYAIKDLDTNEFVVNFDNDFTRISADYDSSYFEVYMNGLEPERYYKILVSSSIGGTEYIFDEKYYFKVING